MGPHIVIVVSYLLEKTNGATSEVYLNLFVSFCIEFSNVVKYVLFANTVLILIQYFLGQMSVLRDGLVQTLTNSSSNIEQTIAYVSPASWPNG